MNAQPFIIYNHAPARHDKFSSILDNYTEQPVLIINIRYLEDAMKYIERGIEKLNLILSDKIKKNPNSILSDSFNYFDRLKRKYEEPSGAY